MKQYKTFPVRHQYGRYYGAGISEDFYGDNEEFWKDKNANTKDVMLPEGKGQENYIKSMCGEVKIYKVSKESDGE